MSGPKKETPKESPAKQPEAPAQSSGASQTQQATAAATAAVSAVREKLVAGEQFMLGAALFIVVVSYFIFDFLLENPVVGDFSVLLAVLTVLAIWVHRWGHYDFGKGYRILIAALGISLAILALMNLLAWARLGGVSDDFLHLLGRLTYWAAGVAAFVGAWQVFRTREV
ncbi:MAG: hypothetical protein PVG27_00490 [Chloroflexota bacterium]|jgi:hypothetical protein